MDCQAEYKARGGTSFVYTWTTNLGHFETSESLIAWKVKFAIREKFPLPESVSYCIGLLENL